MKVVKTIFQIILTVVVLAAIVLAVLAFYFKDTLKPMFTAPEKLVEHQMQSGLDLKERINEFVAEPVRDFTDEELEKMANHQTTAGEVIAKIIIDRQRPDVTEPTEESLTYDYTTWMYELQGKYMSQIEGVIASAKADYTAQLDAGTNAQVAQSSVMATHGNKLRSLQATCDTEVTVLLNEFSARLTDIGADTNIVSAMRAAYNDAKAAVIAKYMNLYNAN